MAPAIMDTMTVHMLNNNVEFRATGSKVKFSGFMKVYVEGTDEKKQEKDKYLPDLEEGMVVQAKDIIPNQHFTQPPPRYTEARLVRSEEHTSELQSRGHLVCRLLLENKNDDGAI